MAKSRQMAINPPLVPPPDARETGESVVWGGQRRTVYERARALSKQVPKKNEEGKVEFKTTPQGQRIRPYTELVFVRDPSDRAVPKLNPGQRIEVRELPEEVTAALIENGAENVPKGGVVHLVEEFILENRGNGMVGIVTGFRPSKHEQELEVRRVRREKALERMGELLETGELDPDSLTAALGGGGAEEEAGEDEETGTTPEQATAETSEATPAKETAAQRKKRRRKAPIG